VVSFSLDQKKLDFVLWIKSYALFATTDRDCCKLDSPNTLASAAKTETPQLWPLDIIWGFETCFGIMIKIPLLQYAFCKELCSTALALAQSIMK